jgi:hypothetical protein
MKNFLKCIKMKKEAILRMGKERIKKNDGGGEFN